jgi:hypothetical protein
MARFERVCPECGASNAYNKAQCSKCRAPLTGAPISNEPPPALLSRQNMTKLAWRATKFLTVMGMTLAWRGAKHGFEKARERGHENVRGKTIDGDFEPAPEPAPELPQNFPPTREWRVWSGSTDDDNAESNTNLHWGTTTPKHKTG